jgi:hypothetical protein
MRYGAIFFAMATHSPPIAAWTINRNWNKTQAST